MEFTSQTQFFSLSTIFFLFQNFCSNKP